MDKPWINHWLIHGFSYGIHGFHRWFFVAKSFSAEVVEIRGLVQAGTIHHMHLAVASHGIPNEERTIYRYEMILIKIY